MLSGILFGMRGGLIVKVTFWVTGTLHSAQRKVIDFFILFTTVSAGKYLNLIRRDLLSYTIYCSVACFKIANLRLSKARIS